jgi:hypothetical protein
MGHHVYYDAERDPMPTSRAAASFLENGVVWAVYAMTFSSSLGYTDDVAMFRAESDAVRLCRAMNAVAGTMRAPRFAVRRCHVVGGLAR